MHATGIESVWRNCTSISFIPIRIPLRVFSASVHLQFTTLHAIRGDFVAALRNPPPSRAVLLQGVARSGGICSAATKSPRIARSPTRWHMYRRQRYLHERESNPGTQIMKQTLDQLICTSHVHCVSFSFSCRYKSAVQWNKLVKLVLHVPFDLRVP